MRGRSSAIAALVGAALAVVACGARDDSYVPPIAVQPGAVARAMQLTQRFVGSTDAGVRAPSPARVHALIAGEELAGDDASGRAGDFVLEDDEVVFVIARSGALVDAADARERRDELESMSLRGATYDELSSGAGSDGSAWVEARGRDASDPSVHVTTRYTLHGGDRALLVATTVANGGGRAVDVVARGDDVEWGSSEPFSSGRAFVGGVGRSVSYAVTSTDGAIDSSTKESRTETEQVRAAALAAGQSVRFERVLLVGERPDVSSLVAELTRASGGALGSIAIGLFDEHGRAVPIARGSKVVLAVPAGDGGTSDAMSMRAVNDGATFGGDVPPGEYVVRFVAGGGRRSAAPAGVHVVVRDGETAHVAVSVGEPGRIAFSCVEARGMPGERGLARAPCEATIDGLDGGTSPDFAYGGLTLANGAFASFLAPGSYRVSVSRGPAYGEARWDAVVRPGAITRGPIEGAIRIPRVVDTSGYVAVDLAPPFVRDKDAREWATSRAAHGSEVALASAAQAVMLASVVRDLHAADRFAVRPGADDAAPDLFPIASLDDVATLAARVHARTPLTAIAASDAHGDARTYVAVDDGGADDVLRGLRERRDVVVTTGPFVRVTANDVSIGGVARALSGGVVAVHVHVECAPGVDVDRARIVRAGGAAVEPKSFVLAVTQSGGRFANVDFSLTVAADDALFVLVDSSTSTADDAPWAMTGALWIDANGDGASLARTPPKIVPKPADVDAFKRAGGARRAPDKNDKNDRDKKRTR